MDAEEYQVRVHDLNDTILHVIETWTACLAEYNTRFEHTLLGEQFLTTLWCLNALLDRARQEGLAAQIWDSIVEALSEVAHDWGYDLGLDQTGSAEPRC